MSVLVAALTWIGAAVVATALASAVGYVGYRVLRRRLPRRILLELDLDSAVAERSPDSGWARFTSGRGWELRELIHTLERAAADARVVGIVARIGTPGLGLAQLTELREAVQRMRAAGKLTVAYADTLGEGESGNAAYYLASAFETVALQPSGEVGLVGVGLQAPFVRRALDKLGVRVHLEAREAHKTAKNTFTETGLTPEHRASLESLAEGVLSELSAGVAEGRRLPIERVRSIFAQGPLTAEQAKAAGLIDVVAYRDQVYRDLEEGRAKSAKKLYLQRYASRVRRRSRGPTLAVVYVVGTLRRGHGRDARTGVPGVEPIAAALRAITKDDKVRGVLLRVDSPGGSYVASDTLWREVVRAREAGKPVVVSMGNYAASGGYFLAAPATAIVAGPCTLTGSIGVFGGKVVVRELLNKFGVDVEGVQTSPNARLYSPIHAYDAEGVQHLGASLDRIYGDFLAKVASGRRLTLEAARAVAGGRVWLGREAMAQGLVDELGGFSTALRRLKRECGLDEQAPVQLRELPLRRPWWSRALAKSPTSSEGETLARAAAAWARLEPLLAELDPGLEADTLELRRSLRIR